MPSILEYLGYIFFFAGFLVGPAFEFMDYRQFTNMEMFRIDNNSDSARGIKINRELKQLKLVKQYYNKSSIEYYVPNGFIPAMSKLSFSIFFILCLVTFGGNYPIDWTLSDEFKSISLLDK